MKTFRNLYPQVCDFENLYLAYRGAYSELDMQTSNLSLAAGLPYKAGFGPTPEVVQGLSSERVHREGVGLSLAQGIGEKWTVSANAGIDYYFFLRRFAWDAGAGVLYRPWRSLDVGGGVSYSSADSRGDEDAENFQLSLEVSNRF